MNTKVKLLRENATFKKAYPNDSGYDLTACDYEYKGNGLWHIMLGVAVEPPEGYYFEIVPRSSFSKTPFVFANNLGVIDSSFRGEIRFPVKYLNVPLQWIRKLVESSIKAYLLNNRIAQAILRRYYDSEIEIVQELSETDRGSNGFGSTGQC